MIKYIKSFREFIPTWLICIFMFFGIYGWTFAIGVVLLVIQFWQRYKINKRLECADASANAEIEPTVITNDAAKNDETNEKIHALLDTLRKNDEELKRCHEQIRYLNNNSRKNKELDSIIAENGKLRNELESVIDKNNILQNEVDAKNSIISELDRTLEELKSESEKRGKEYPEGQYLVGRDIPLGGYTLVSKNKSGYVQLYPSYSKFRKEEDEILWETFNETFKISLLENGSYLFVSGATICPDDSNVSKKNIIDSEIDAIKAELNTLNSNCIHKYYMFSDYDGISSDDCKNKIVLLKQKERDMRNAESDIIINDSDSSKRSEARIIRQMLRTFNSECDNIMLNMSWKNIDIMRNKIQKSYDTINMLYSTNGISLTSDLLELKLEQATTLYTMELKQQQEKEIQKAIKEQMLEEARAEKEIEEQKKKIDKDLQQHMGERNRLMKYIQKTQIDAEKQLYIDKIKELEAKIKELESDKETVLEREANAKAGYVYIISNIGSFGENIYKIGMTRRLEPMDRVKELSSASVPFEFDVHAMIFSSDAPELETMLHRHFADKAVNKVNPRKEFYNVDIDEIEKIVKENYNDTVQFTKIPIATEYRQTLNMQ